MSKHGKLVNELLKLHLIEEEEKSDKCRSMVILCYDFFEIVRRMSELLQMHDNFAVFRFIYDFSTTAASSPDVMKGMLIAKLYY
jgi:hypothetical protein